jgi:hypothetical protein
MLSCWAVLNTLMNSVFRFFWWRTQIPEMKYRLSQFKIHSALTVWSTNLLWYVFETTERTPYSGVCTTKTNRLILCVDIIHVYFESLLKHKLLGGKNFLKCWNRWYIFIRYQLWTGRSKVWVPAGVRDFSSPKRPNRLWGTPRLKFKWVLGVFCPEVYGGGVNLTTSLKFQGYEWVELYLHFHYVLLWRAQGQFCLYLYAVPTFVTSLFRTSEIGRWFVMFLKWTRNEVINLFSAVQMIRARSVLKMMKECLRPNGGCLYAVRACCCRFEVCVSYVPLCVPHCDNWCKTGGTTDYVNKRPDLQYRRSSEKK